MNKKQQSLSGMHHLKRIHPLLERPEKRRGLEWLELALQSAVSVEFSTIPPYLSALWSIKDQMHPVAASIRNVVQEEMLHMSLACNMLTAIGCVPRINDPKMVPSYPGRFPEGSIQNSLYGWRGCLTNHWTRSLRSKPLHGETVPKVLSKGKATKRSARSTTRSSANSER